MPKAKQAFTYRRWVTADDEGNVTEVSEPYDEDGNVKEGAYQENVIVGAGEDVDLSSEDKAGLAQFLEDDEAPTGDSGAKDRATPSPKLAQEK
jgi:hypothetical protein